MAAGVNSEPAYQRAWFLTERRSQKRYLRNMQFQASRILMDRALLELTAGRLDEYEKFSVRARNGVAERTNPPRGDAPRGDTPLDEPTEHERYLDVRRVRITAGLLLALFIVVGVVLWKSKTIGSTATPYVSLLSGLAGIALGWMFASSGGPVARPAGHRQPGHGNTSAKIDATVQPPSPAMQAPARTRTQTPRRAGARTASGPVLHTPTGAVPMASTGEGAQTPGEAP